MTRFALTGPAIVTLDGVRSDAAILVVDGIIADVVDRNAVPPTFALQDLETGWLLPGFIDAQVNGGGDVLFNDDPGVDGIRAIAAAHRRYGTTALLPTLISDYPDVVARAIDATEAAIAENVPGVIGIHVEGPYLNREKHGIHDPERFRAIDDSAIDLLTRPSAGVRLVTIAPELVPSDALRSLVNGGVVVAGGHSLADYDQTRAAIDAGLRGFTHLFNAMTSMESRAPGMVGAALENQGSYFGLIVDGVHVHPATLRVALAAHGLDGAMLVTDAMPPVGGNKDGFDLMGVHIVVRDGSCRGPDGTLAGSSLNMAQAVRNALDMLKLPIDVVSRLASANPARFLGIEDMTGTIAKGLRADFVHLDAERRVTRTWIAGEVSEIGECPAT